MMLCLLCDMFAFAIICSSVVLYSSVVRLVHPYRKGVGSIPVGDLIEFFLTDPAQILHLAVSRPQFIFFCSTSRYLTLISEIT